MSEQKEPVESPSKTKRKRKVFQKELYLAVSGDDAPLEETSMLQIAAGPFGSTEEALKTLADFDDGEFQLVYLGRKVLKTSVSTSVVTVEDE